MRQDDQALNPAFRNAVSRGNQPPTVLNQAQRAAAARKFGRGGYRGNSYLGGMSQAPNHYHPVPDQGPIVPRPNTSTPTWTPATSPARLKPLTALQQAFKKNLPNRSAAKQKSSAVNQPDSGRKDPLDVLRRSEESREQHNKQWEEDRAGPVMGDFDSSPRRGARYERPSSGGERSRMTPVPDTRVRPAASVSGMRDAVDREAPRSAPDRQLHRHVVEDAQLESPSSSLRRATSRLSHGPPVTEPRQMSSSTSLAGRASSLDARSTSAQQNVSRTTVPSPSAPSTPPASPLLAVTDAPPSPPVLTLSEPSSSVVPAAPPMTSSLPVIEINSNVDTDEMVCWVKTFQIPRVLAVPPGGKIRPGGYVLWLKKLYITAAECDGDGMPQLRVRPVEQESTGDAEADRVRRNAATTFAVRVRRTGLPEGSLPPWVGRVTKDEEAELGYVNPRAFAPGRVIRRVGGYIRGHEGDEKNGGTKRKRVPSTTDSTPTGTPRPSTSTTETPSSSLAVLTAKLQICLDAQGVWQSFSESSPDRRELAQAQISKLKEEEAELRKELDQAKEKGRNGD